MGSFRSGRDLAYQACTSASFSTLAACSLEGRAAPALASIDRNGRVIHIGSYSKTISPALRLGFLVAPLPLASRFAEVAACLAPAPGPSVQLATAEFMREGHYMRHLRRAKRLYSAQRDALLKCLRPRAKDSVVGGLAVVLRLPDGAPDVSIAKEAQTFGLRDSPWLLSAIGSPQQIHTLGFMNGSPPERIHPTSARSNGATESQSLRHQSM